ncbi:MAG TPA: thermonuclease family protein, partial [Oligoflexia bacterium]|nr:thermonuclease family protein [Oligoflexia bacterium]
MARNEFQRAKPAYVLSEGVRGNFFFRKKEFPRFYLIFYFVFFAASWCGPVFAESFSGEVVGVVDGDTIFVMLEGRTNKVRLWGIDCPETGQAFGKRAKQFTSSKVFG